MEIEQFIPYGRENAVSRKELAKLTGLPDRLLRDTIKQANKRLEAQGEAILSSSGNRGYWRSTSIEEMEQYKAESDRRRRSQAINDEPILRIIAKAKGQRFVAVGAYIRRLRKEPEEPRQIDGQTRFGGGDNCQTG